MDIRLQATGAADPQKLQGVMNNFLMELNMAPGIMLAFSAYSANTSHLDLEVDRVKASLMNVEVSAIFSALQNYLGSRYVNDFNFGGQVNRAIGRLGPLIGAGGNLNPTTCFYRSKQKPRREGRGFCIPY